MDFDHSIVRPEPPAIDGLPSYVPDGPQLSFGEKDPAAVQVQADTTPPQVEATNRFRRNPAILRSIAYCGSFAAGLVLSVSRGLQAANGFESTSTSNQLDNTGLTLLAASGVCLAIDYVRLVRKENRENR